MKKSVSAELPGKIVFTSSLANLFGEIDFDNLNLEKGGYSNPLKAYANTKLMVRILVYLCINILFDKGLKLNYNLLNLCFLINEEYYY
jgi:hypothetical protein